MIIERQAFIEWLGAETRLHSDNAGLIFHQGGDKLKATHAVKATRSRRRSIGCSSSRPIPAEVALRNALTVFWLALALVVSVTLAETQKPLSKTQIDDLVASGLDSGTIAKVVSERGIDFEPTDRYLDILRSAGAMQVLIDALRSATPAPMSKAQLLHALAGGMPQDDLAAMVERRGIDFKPTPQDLDTLRIAGAGDKLYQAVARARQSAAASSPASGSKSGSPGGTVYEVGGDVMAPVPIYHPDPSYSDEARRAKYSGVVQLAIVVNTDGDVTDARLEKPIGYGLDQKAVETVKTWKFKPATRNGTPVPVRLLTEVTFRLY